MAANDNGKKVSASYGRERDLADTGWGVRMLYETSFSPHKVAVGSNRKAVTFAKRCSTKKKARLTASGKGSRRTLTCKPRKGRSSTLRVG